MKRIISILIVYTFITSGLGLAEELPKFDREAYIASAVTPEIISLKMDDCVMMALKNNSEINIVRIVPQIQDANVLIQRAVFEPDVSFNFMMGENTEINDTPLFGPSTTKTRTGVFNFGYDQKLVTGTMIALDFNNTRTTSNLSEMIQSYNPLFDSVAQGTITQPLLKGFGITVNKADYLIAKNNKLRSVQEFKRDVISTLTDVKKSYYDFQNAQELYRVAEASLARVQNLHDINRQKYAKGLASNVDLLESEAEVARFEQALYAAENFLKTSEDKLKLITNLVDDVRLWNAKTILLEEIDYRKSEIDLVDSILKAFHDRPDYEAAKIDLRSKDLSIVFYRNNMLPEVDLVASLGLNGLDKVYEKDLAHIGGGKYKEWSLGVNVTLPLGSEEEKGKYDKSKLEKKQALINFKRLEQKIILEVRDAVRTIDIKYRMLEASKKAKDAQEKNYEAQEKRFKAGLVSTLDINIYQENLARAQANYINSVIQFNIALVELAKAKGTTLMDDNITIE